MGENARKILFVDDDPSILEAFKRGLRKEFSVDTAEDGEEALRALAQKGPYAVIVADLRMPMMSGTELLHRVRDLAPTTVRIVLTAECDKESAYEAFTQGHAFRVLNKPCDRHEMISVLEDAVRHHRHLQTEGKIYSDFSALPEV